MPNEWNYMNEYIQSEWEQWEKKANEEKERGTAEKKNIKEDWSRSRYLAFNLSYIIQIMRSKRFFVGPMKKKILKN